jgi:hypothetical protein
MKSLGLILLGILFASQTYAGVGSSGGGLAVVCRDPQGVIESAELLDLYEGVARDHLTIVSPLDSVEAEYLYFTQEIRHVVGDTRPVDQSVVSAFDQIMDGSFHFLPAGAHPAPTCDMGSTIPVPPGCDIEQLATYDDQTNIIDVDSEIWSALNTVNQGALIAHETLYRDYRVAGDQTSENVRRLVALLFSTTPPAPETDGVPQSAYTCWAASAQQSGSSDMGTSGNTAFYLYSDPRNPGQTVLRFAILLARDTLGPVDVEVPVQLDPSALVPATNQSASLIVNQPGNDFVGTETVQGGGLFQGYSVQIQYQFQKPFSISLFDPNGQLVGTAYGMSCSDGLNQVL